MSAYIIQGDALHLPLPDASVDLIVTSPPFFALRSYQDAGGHYSGQIGSEATPQDFLEALWKATEEMVRVLKPSGSIFVNLGDKYAGSGGHNNAGLAKPHTGSITFVGQAKNIASRPLRRNAPDRYNQSTGGVRAKSLMLLPERYRIGCVDRLGLIARAVIEWSKPNGLPESVTDRVRRSHEDWVHLTKEPRYFSAVDEIREQYSTHSESFYEMKRGWQEDTSAYHVEKEAVKSNGPDGLFTHNPNPLGKLPGSVWEIPSEPLLIPKWAKQKYDLPDHFAAFPQELPRRLILGWSPSGVCVECGEGRRPVVDKAGTGRTAGTGFGKGLHDGSVLGRAVNPHGGMASWEETTATITGYACACPEPTAETRPALILDPFMGTGTTLLVAKVLGRDSVGVDMSADYCRLARWRVEESGHGAKALRRTWKERQEGLAL